MNIAVNADTDTIIAMKSDDSPMLDAQEIADRIGHPVYLMRGIMGATRRPRLHALAQRIQYARDALDAALFEYIHAKPGFWL